MSATHRFTFDENDLKNNSKEDDLCTRCIRKKYRCIMVFLGVILLLIQSFHLIIGKLDDEQLSYIFKRISKDFKLLMNSSRIETIEQNLTTPASDTD